MASENASSANSEAELDPTPTPTPQDEAISRANKTNGSEEYPYPWQVNAASFVSIKLSGKGNYEAWEKQVVCLLESHDMLGFVDGTIEKPQTKYYKEWKRSDMLVKGWIFGSLSEDVMKSCVDDVQTPANEVWHKLKTDYGTTTPANDESGIHVSANEQEEQGEDMDYGPYIPLCRAIQTGDWEKAAEFFIKDKDALTNKLNVDEARTLHIAIGNPKNVWILEKLLELISPDLLPSLVNDNKHTALHFAAKLDNTVAAQKVVDKNPLLLFLKDNENYLPIEIAAINSHRSTLLYLIQACKHHIHLCQNNGCSNPFEGPDGVSVLRNTILAGFLDVAYQLLMEYPKLATTKGSDTPLWGIAKRWDAYPSAKRYNFYERFIYSYVPTENYDVKDQTSKTQDIERQETYNLVRSYAYHATERIYARFWKVALLHVPNIKSLHEDKMKHNTALAILKFICEEIGKLKCGHFDHYVDAFKVAVKNDTPEVIEQITRLFPQSIWIGDNGYKLSQLSIMNRCEHVYNFLVHEVTQDKYLHNLILDDDKNNLLHLAGRLAPTDKLDMVTGAALQMQRELQWFEEVSKFMRPREREKMNKNQETPIMVFRKEHKDLRQKGEEWIKKAADSYTITAALIITIVFAASITVPGGNNGSSGKAIYVTKPSFIIFFISDAISLFTSTTSLLLFLSILTARYADQDFLYKLPKRLILGLVMLFMSVTSMLIAFSATIYITFGQGKSWILIPIGAITCLPIASFVTLQLPLLNDLISSTYGSGIFGKRSELRLTS